MIPYLVYLTHDVILNIGHDDTVHTLRREDTIDVGADMYEIDTEAEATVEASAESSSSAPAKAAAPPAKAPAEKPAVAAAKPAAPSSSSHHRTPSIKFLGKDGWKQRLLGGPAVNTAPIPPNYGRPVFTEEEMEALMMGGANLVPDVKQHSGGAMFG
jgi:hypothetical protein